jgi:hypothetical protein
MLFNSFEFLAFISILYLAYLVLYYATDGVSSAVAGSGFAQPSPL